MPSPRPKAGVEAAVSGEAVAAKTGNRGWERFERLDRAAAWN